MTVGKPEILTKSIDGKTIEPVEHLVIDCGTVYRRGVQTPGSCDAEDRAAVLSRCGPDHNLDILSQRHKETQQPFRRRTGGIHHAASSRTSG